MGGKWVFFIPFAATASWGRAREGRRLKVTVPNGPNRVRASLLAAYHSISLVMLLSIILKVDPLARITY